MEKVLALGYERLSETEHAMDLLIEQLGEGTFRIVEASIPSNDDWSPIYYRMEEYTVGCPEDVKQSFLRVQRNEGNEQDFLAIVIGHARATTIFRTHVLPDNKNLFTIHAFAKQYVIGKKKSDRIPNLYYNEDGHLEMEDTRENMYRMDLEISGFSNVNDGVTEQDVLDTFGQLTKQMDQRGEIHEQIIREVEKSIAGNALAKEALRG